MVSIPLQAKTIPKNSTFLRLYECKSQKTLDNSHSCHNLGIVIGSICKETANYHGDDVDDDNDLEFSFKGVPISKIKSTIQQLTKIA